VAGPGRRALAPAPRVRVLASGDSVTVLKSSRDPVLICAGAATTPAVENGARCYTVQLVTHFSQFESRIEECEPGAQVPHRPHSAYGSVRTSAASALCQNRSCSNCPSVTGLICSNFVYFLVLGVCFGTSLLGTQLICYHWISVAISIVVANPVGLFLLAAI
jgi:hypothetical protein